MMIDRLSEKAVFRRMDFTVLSYVYLGSERRLVERVPMKLKRIMIYIL